MTEEGFACVSSPIEGAQALGSTALRTRVAALDANMRQRLLANAVSIEVTCRVWLYVMLASQDHMQGVEISGILNEEPVRDTDWGFATRLPRLPQMLEHASDQSKKTSSGGLAPSIGDGFKLAVDCRVAALVTTCALQGIWQPCKRAEPSTVQTVSTQWLKHTG